MKRGFTLIELLVVVLIIGILAAIALPQYTKAVEKSRMAEAVLNMGNMVKAINIYNLTQGNTNALDENTSPADVWDIDLSGGNSWTYTTCCGWGYRTKHFIYLPFYQGGNVSALRCTGTCTDADMESPDPEYYFEQNIADGSVKCYPSKTGALSKVCGAYK
ncbi:prepilin-type N-terminal cleavage/methylation domain-containing protein [Elusimicrobium simillimum]|uniref:type IV pilin protein n=1 Tax=Elusimicrobium simillimum TaxID=3143438 RepID=UPI003C6EB994